MNKRYSGLGDRHRVPGESLEGLLWSLLAGGRELADVELETVAHQLGYATPAVVDTLAALGRRGLVYRRRARFVAFRREADFSYNISPAP